MKSQKFQRIHICKWVQKINIKKEMAEELLIIQTYSDVHEIKMLYAL